MLRLPITRIVIVREGNLYVPGSYELVKKKLQDAKKGKTPIRGYFELPVLCWIYKYKVNGSLKIEKSYSDDYFDIGYGYTESDAKTDVKKCRMLIECVTKYLGKYQTISEVPWFEDKKYIPDGWQLSRSNLLKARKFYRKAAKERTELGKEISCELKTVQNSKVTSINQCSLEETSATSYQFYGKKALNSFYTNLFRQGVQAKIIEPKELKKIGW